jgi:hypothetical protein
MSPASSPISCRRSSKTIFDKSDILAIPQNDLFMLLACGHGTLRGICHASTWAAAAPDNLYAHWFGRVFAPVLLQENKNPFGQ